LEIRVVKFVEFKEGSRMGWETRGEEVERRYWEFERGLRVGGRERLKV
jgi:hypothetical protein